MKTQGEVDASAGKVFEIFQDLKAKAYDEGELQTVMANLPLQGLNNCWYAYDITLVDGNFED